MWTRRFQGKKQMMLSRRSFSSGMLASSAFAILSGPARAMARESYRNEARGYGPLLRDPNGVLDLPAGFSYRVISFAGQRMDDGLLVPDNADGMGCFGLGGSKVALVRNHELKPDDRAGSPTGGLAALEPLLAGKPAFGRDAEGRILPGGTTTILYDLATGRTERQHLSLAGTAVNCAGGVTPWGSWLTCEETVLGKRDGLTQDHGWVFDVPAAASRAVTPVPLVGLGRFRHEAAAIDPRTGIAYLTEDRDDSLFYRFLPAQKKDLTKGGRLQALGLRNFPEGADTRNWVAPVFTEGAWEDARWIDLDGVDNPYDDLRLRGHAKGAAIFARGEGIHFGDHELYFTCTSGGAKRIGQVMRYVPGPQEGEPGESRSPGRLQLFVESAASELLDYGDNLTIAPWGHVIVCEDRAGNPMENYLRGITPEGKLYTIARHPGATELAGACFSPDGSTLFLNLYSPGRTMAITGPWRRFG
jgi:secreted PhoX family phosphatase